MRPWGVAVVLLATVLSGCLSGGETGPGADAPSGPTKAFYEDDRIKLQNITTEDQRPTLLEAPKWKQGEWWKVELQEDFTGRSYTTHSVVAAAEDDAFLVGMPNHDFSNDIMVLHIPGFGQVSKANLGFEIHDCVFQPLQFPLKEGAKWSTQFECRDVEAEVIEVDGLKAMVHMAGNNDIIDLTYDAELRAISELNVLGYGSYKVVGHGWQFHADFPQWDGLVTVPHQHDLIFQHGRLGAVTWGSLPTPLGVGVPAPQAGITDTVLVDSNYDRVSFVTITGSVIGLLTGQSEPPANGYYSERATAPDGTEYYVEQLPTEPGLKIVAFKHDAPGGDWAFEHVVAGPGIAMAEGIAYHVYDVQLPSGRILPSVGEHKHGSDEEHH